jgi:hypothetical protein
MVFQLAWGQLQQTGDIFQANRLRGSQLKTDATKSNPSKPFHESLI